MLLAHMVTSRKRQLPKCPKVAANRGGFRQTSRVRGCLILLATMMRPSAPTSGSCGLRRQTGDTKKLSS